MKKLTLSVEKLSDKHKENFEQLRQKARLEERLGIIEKLEIYFPQCFNFKRPLPLKVGIEADVIKNLPEGAFISRKKLQRAIKYYVSNINYRKTLIKSTFRHDLQGKPTGAIDPDHKVEASRWLAEVREKHTMHARKYNKTYLAKGSRYSY